MAVPRRLLLPGEHVLIDVRPHWTFLAGPLVTTVLVVALAVTLDIDLPRTPVPVHWIEGLVAAVPCVWLVVRMVRWRLTDLVLTNLRVLHRYGLGSPRVDQARLDTIVRVEVDQSLLRRLLGTGRIAVVVPAPEGGELYAVVAGDVPRPAVFQRVVHRRLRRPDGAMPYPPGYRPGRGGGPATPV